MNIETKTFERLHHTFCYKILPLVYDNSLSYYELLCRVQHTVNEIIAYLDELGPGLDNVIKEFNELKEYVDNYFDNLDVQDEINNKIDNMIDDGTFVELLQEIALGYITPEMYGAKGDGTTDDSENFTEAVAVSLASNKPLKLHENSYNLPNITDGMQMCSLYGDGANIYSTGYSFTYGDVIELIGINFYNDDRYLKNESPRSLFYSANERKRVVIDNCTYTCRLADDTHRGRIFFRGFTEEMHVQNVTLKGAFDCFILSNSTTLKNVSYTFDKITAYNTESCIDIEGYKNPNTFEGFLSNVHISNITMINTENEQLNVNTEVGRDCLLLGNVENFTVDNVYCERPAERAIYCSICRNGTISNITAKNTDGIKIGGTFFTVADIKKSFNIMVENVNVIDGINGRAIVMYNARNITTNNISFINYSGYGSHMFELTGVLNEITITNIKAINCIRGIIIMFETDGWTNSLTDIFIDGVKAVDPVATLTGFYAIRAVGNNNIFIHGLSIYNVLINEGNELYRSGSFLEGAVKLEYAEHVKIDNVRAYGVGYLNTPQLDIATTCQAVYVTGEYMCVFGQAPNIYSSNGSYTMFAVQNRGKVTARFECYGGYNLVPALPPHVIEKIGSTLEIGDTIPVLRLNSGRTTIFSNVGKLVVDWQNGTPTVLEQSGNANVTSGAQLYYSIDNDTVTCNSGQVYCMIIVERAA